MCLSPSSIWFPAAPIMCLHSNVLDWLSHCLRFVYPHLSYLPSRQVIFSSCVRIPSLFNCLGSFTAWQPDFCYHWAFKSPSLFFDFLPKLRCPIISDVSSLLRLRPQIRRTFCWMSQVVDGLSPLCFYSILFILYQRSLVLHVYQILIMLSQKIPNIYLFS